MEEVSRQAVAPTVESCEHNPDADRDAVEDRSVVDMLQPAAEDGAHSQSNALDLSHASRNEDFVVVDLVPTLQEFHQPALTEQLQTTDAATQSDDDTETFAKALENSNRRIEELERRSDMQQAQIARIENEMAACRRECAEQISSMRQYVDAKTSGVKPSERQNNEATDIKQSWSLHFNQSGESVRNDGFERVRTVQSGAERVSALLPSRNTVGCEEGAGVQIRQEVAAYRQECENQILGLRQRLEASCFELRLQCSAYVTALERRLRETMSVEHETMRSCVKEMTLLRDYVTSMTDVIETIVSLYAPRSDTTRPATDSGNVSKSDTPK